MDMTQCAGLEHIIWMMSERFSAPFEPPGAAASVLLRLSQRNEWLVVPPHSLPAVAHVKPHRLYDFPLESHL